METAECGDQLSLTGDGDAIIFGHTKYDEQWCPASVETIGEVFGFHGNREREKDFTTLPFPFRRGSSVTGHGETKLLLVFTSARAADCSVRRFLTGPAKRPNRAETIRSATVFDM